MAADAVAGDLRLLGDRSGLALPGAGLGAGLRTGGDCGRGGLIDSGLVVRQRRGTRVVVDELGRTIRGRIGAGVVAALCVGVVPGHVEHLGLHLNGLDQTSS